MNNNNNNAVAKAERRQRQRRSSFKTWLRMFVSHAKMFHSLAESKAQREPRESGWAGGAERGGMCVSKHTNVLAASTASARLTACLPTRLPACPTSVQFSSEFVFYFFHFAVSVCPTSSLSWLLRLKAMYGETVVYR